MAQQRNLPGNRQPDKPQVTIASNAVTPDILAQFLTNQAEQIEVQRKEQDIQLKEQDIRLREIDSSNGYSLRALDAQLTDRENSRKHELAMRQTRYRYWISAGAFGSALFVGGLISCVVCGQTTLALDIVKTVIPPLITAVSGYFIGINQGKNKAKQEAAEATAQK